MGRIIRSSEKKHSRDITFLPSCVFSVCVCFFLRAQQVLDFIESVIQYYNIIKPLPDELYEELLEKEKNKRTNNSHNNELELTKVYELHIPVYYQVYHYL